MALSRTNKLIQCGVAVVSTPLLDYYDRGFCHHRTLSVTDDAYSFSLTFFTNVLLARHAAAEGD